MVAAARLRRRYVGYDLDPAFVELARRGAEGLATVGVAVIDEETDPEVAASADLSVTSPHGAVGVLTWLAAQNSSEG